MNTPKQLRLVHPDGHSWTAYLELHDHPHKLVRGIVAKTIRLHSLIDDYNGPALNLDLDHSGRAIGIEILYPTPEDFE
jgi:hypothetical protein